jgi:hypothetical protein
MSQFPVAHDSDGEEVPDAWDDEAEIQEEATADTTIAANGHVAASSNTAAMTSAVADSDDEDSDGESDDGDSSDYASQVLSAYRKLQSRRVDLVGDYAGNELFIIDGDSLLLRCFSDTRLDFDPGFQLLHAVYNVEQVLQHLARRKCNFHLVFFRSSKTVCVPSTATKASAAKFLLARAAIVRHLQANLPASHPDIKIEEFPSYASPEFAQYLTHHAPYFVMAHDGAEATQRKGKHVPVGTDVSVDVQLNANRAALREMILFFIDQGYNVALLNGLEFRDTKAMAIVLERRRRDLQIPTSQTSLLPLQSDTGDDENRGALDKARTSTPHLTQRQLLAVITISRFIGGKSEQMPMARSFLEHECILSHLPLSARRLSLQESTAEVDNFLRDVSNLAEMTLYSESWQEALGDHVRACDIADFVDGRLFLQIHHRSPQLTDAMRKTFTELAEAVKQLSGLDITENEQPPTAPPPAKGAPVSPAPEGNGSLAVMPFSNPVFDPHLATIRLEVDENIARHMSSSQHKVFREVTHWHNAKKPIIQKGPPTAKSQKEEFWAKKRNQIFMGEMQKYAASLTNAVGRSLEPETIIVGSEKTKALPRSGRDTPDSDSADSSTSATKNKAPPKKAGGGKKGQQTAGKQAIMNQIAATKAKKDEAAGDKIINAWHTVCKAIDAGDDPRAKFTKAKAHLASLPSASRDVVAAECQLYMVSCLLQRWIALCKKKEKEQHLELAALIWSVCSQVLSSDHLTKDVVSNVNLTVNTLGLPPVISKSSDSLPPRKLVFTFALPTTVHGISVGLLSKDFQLRYCGPYLERSFDSAPDPRVDFNPDGWQRKVLDAIDADKSVFAVAPTSAGKTFISFYAMRKVLEADDDSVLVYVAPTKALVNQIAAEVSVS